MNSKPTPPIKICTDCAHSVLDRTRRYVCFKTARADLVHGGPVAEPCESVRLSEFECGREGKWFESKPITVKPVEPQKQGFWGRFLKRNLTWP